MKTNSLNRTLRTSLSVGLAAVALSLLLLFLVSARQAMATAPIAGDPVSTEGVVTILTPDDGVMGLVALDLDDDGRTDLAFGDGNDVRIVANASTTETVSWPSSPVITSTTAPVADLAAADFDRDGLVDLAVASADGSGVGELRLLRNPTSTSPFTALWSQGQVLTSSAQLTLTTVVAGDLDGDGVPDLASAGGDGVIRLWRNPMTDTWDSTVWDSPTEISTSDGEISEIALADVDRDGRLDIVSVSNGATPRVRAWRNPGAPFSSAWSTTNLLGSLGSDGLSLAVADLDQDDAPDVAAGLADGSVLIWRNPLTGAQPFATGWAAAITVESGTGPVEALQAADVDNDGYAELVRGTGGGSPSLVIWHSRGAPFTSDWFSHTVGTSGQTLRGLATADFDRDGDVDVVSGDAGGLRHWLNVLLHRSVPFGNETEVGEQDTIEAFAAGDLDNDGRSDIAAADYGGRICLWRNAGTPFDSGWPTICWNSGRQIRSLTLGDLDGDGYLDLVTGHAYEGDLMVWQNDGTPFDAAWDGTTIASVLDGDYENTWVMALALGDLNRDGVTDLVVGTNSDFGGSVPVTRSTNFVLYAGHYDGTPFSDATWSWSTISVTLDGVNAIALGDLDNDGQLDVVAGTNHAPAVVTQTEWYDSYQLRAFRNDGTAFDGYWPGFNVGRDPETYTFAWYGPSFHGYYGASTNAVALADLDNDGDLDIATGDAWEADYQVKVWENDGTPFDGDLWDFSATGLGSQWPGTPWPWLDEAHARTLTAGDFNQDGLVDLVSGHEFGTVIHWENSGLPFSDVPTDVHWIRHDVGDIEGAIRGVAAADLDRDGDLDLAAAERAVDHPTVYAWQNRGGAVGEYVIDTAPAEIAEGTRSTLAGVVVAHNGKWLDHDVELAWWRLTLVDDDGVPLTGTRATNLFDDVRVYHDDGDGIWEGEPSDSLVVNLTVTSTTLDSSGVLTITFPAGDPLTRLSIGQQEGYFVVATLESDASVQEPSAFEMILDADAASLVQDHTTSSAVSIEDTDPITTGPVLVSAGPPTSVVLDTSPAEIAADGISTAVVTATVSNAVGHPVDDGTTVSFTTTLGSVVPLTGTTAGGVATATLTSSIDLGTAVVTATAGAASGDASVAFVPGAPDAVAVEFLPSSVVADGVSTAVVTATVTDAHSHLVADGTTVGFTTTLGSIAPLTGTTTGGVATATLTSSTELGTAVVTATAGVASGDGSVAFVPGAPDAVAVDASPVSVVADGVSTAVVTATVTDAYSRLVADGTVVSFTTTLGSISSSALTSGGVATATLTSPSNPGIAVVTATVGGIYGQTSVTFTEAVHTIYLPIVTQNVDATLQSVPRRRLSSRGEQPTSVDVSAAECCKRYSLLGQTTQQGMTSHLQSIYAQTREEIWLLSSFERRQSPWFPGFDVTAIAFSPALEIAYRNQRL
jgi:hypothetical protein